MEAAARALRLSRRQAELALKARSAKSRPRFAKNGSENLQSDFRRAQNVLN